MNQIVVVGVDGSETSQLAARRAAELAAATGSSLHVVTAYDRNEVDEVKVGSDHWVLSSVDQAIRTAESAADGLTEIVGTITTGVGEGKPHDVLIGEAQRLDASMIVVGNRRMQGIARVLGSVANSVAHHAPCDVLIVKTV